jgi:L-ascorbate metabolism protein UlaG (beta-lactamase superfamily)
MIQLPALSVLTVWYLGHCGFAVQSGNRLLVFDYLSERGTPALETGAGGLQDGTIDATDLQQFEAVYVFVTHSHSDHYDPAILGWEEEAERVHYFFGWQAGENPAHHYLVGPRATAQVDGMEVYTINSHHSDVPEVAFLVHLDGRWIYHNGDYQQDYIADFEYLGTLTDHMDLVFHAGLTNEEWQYTHQGYYLMEHFHPDAFFPMHFGGTEEEMEDFPGVMAERGYDTFIPLPRRRGDSWRIR